jgi:prepilin-type N-terminal cleavage/methylation domain-containing protein
MYQRGFGLIEILIAVSIISATIFAFTEVSTRSVRLTSKAVAITQVGFLLDEGVEAVKIIRDTAWTNISGTTNGTTYYLNFSGSAWSFTQTPNTIDSLTRTVVFSPVYRDGADDIATTGTLDSNTKKVTITVSWIEQSGSTVSKVVELYITNVFI